MSDGQWNPDFIRLRTALLRQGENIRTARMLLGREPGCKGHLTAYRQGRSNVDGAPLAGRRPT